MSKIVTCEITDGGDVRLDVGDDVTVFDMFAMAGILSRQANTVMDGQQYAAAMERAEVLQVVKSIQEAKLS